MGYRTLVRYGAPGHSFINSPSPRHFQGRAEVAGSNGEGVILQTTKHQFYLKGQHVTIATTGSRAQSCNPNPVNRGSNQQLGLLSCQMVAYTRILKESLSHLYLYINIKKTSDFLTHLSFFTPELLLCLSVPVIPSPHSYFLKKSLAFCIAPPWMLISVRCAHHHGLLVHVVGTFGNTVPGRCEGNIGPTASGSGRR